MECELCAVSKATQRISRSKEVDYSATKPFEHCSWDMLKIFKGYNSDKYILHLCCKATSFQFVYTYCHKFNALGIIKQIFAIIEAWGFKVLFICLDGEKSLQIQFDNFIQSKGTIAECTPTDMHEQNGDSEKSGRDLSIAACTTQIEARLSHNLWPECYKDAGYKKNRTPIKRLG